MPGSSNFAQSKTNHLRVHVNWLHLLGVFKDAPLFSHSLEGGSLLLAGSMDSRLRGNDLEFSEQESKPGAVQKSVPLAQPTPSKVRPKVLSSLKKHWPEYIMEACELGFLAFMACASSALFRHPASPLSHIFDGNGLLQRLAVGLVMGITITGIIYSPMGKRSGAHINPAVTFTFLRLGKIGAADGFFYMLFQFAGGIAGVTLAGLTLGSLVAAPEVNFAATEPGSYGAVVAFFAEMGISAIIMGTVLYVTNHKRIMHKVGLYVGILYAAYITLEQPFSGTSMNPARTLGSVLMTGSWAGTWIYFTAPLMGMLLASEIFLWTKGKDAIHCAKLLHTTDVRRIVRCGWTAFEDENNSMEENNDS